MSKTSLILWICILLCFPVILLWKFFVPINPDLGWNLIAEIIGVILTAILITLLLDFWSKRKWKPFLFRIKNDFLQDINNASSYINAIFGSLEPITIKKRLASGSPTIDQYMNNIKAMYNERIEKFTIPDDLLKISKCFEECRKLFYNRYKEYEFFLNPDFLMILNDIRDQLHISSVVPAIEYNIMHKGKLTVKGEEYIKGAKNRVKEGLEKSIALMEKLHISLRREYILRDGI